uniref:Reverse transcriptase Ty1/copia-type domain-containing protein n=1 Tax=Fagus sylvatica TaxID=28930 RepID=A0A2N9I4W8_FAGSY
MTGTSCPKSFLDHHLYYSTHHPLQAFHAATLPFEPTTFSQATKLPEWQQAMAAEFEALMANGTWSLCPRPPNHKIIRNKWVYRLTQKADGSIDHHKAWLVAKGFDQEDDINYTETFSPVIKPTTIRVLLALAVQFSWSIRQLDVSNAFLHGFLLEDAFMEQPRGFIDPTHPNHYYTLTRPDIAFSVNQLCQFLHSPTSTHWTAAKRVLRYLKGTITHGLFFSKGSLSLQAFCDSDWASSPNDRCTEAEYRAMAVTTVDLYWLRMLLKDLQVPLSSLPVLWCDNAGALAFASNPVFHACTKHIEVNYHFIREKVVNRDMSLKFISTGDQCGDFFTKGLSTHRF